MSRGADRDIAIVGLGLRFAGAPDLFTFWANILANRDVPREFPADAGPSRSSAIRFGRERPRQLPPWRLPRFADRLRPVPARDRALAVVGGEPEQFLVLNTARAALVDAALDPTGLDHLRVDVVVGRGNYFNRGNLTRLQHGRIVAQTVAVLAALTRSGPRRISNCSVGISSQACHLSRRRQSRASLPTPPPDGCRTA